MKGHHVFYVSKFQLSNIHVSKVQILENPNLKAQVLEVHILNIQVSNKGHVFESVNLIWVDETIKGPQELERNHDENSLAFLQN